MNHDWNIRNLKDIYFKKPMVVFSEDCIETYMNEVVKPYCKLLCEFIRSKNKSLNEIVDYINSSYCDYEFSLRNVADRFNINSSSLSQIFKINTGETLISYLWNLRLNKVKELLANTDRPIREIISNVGYIDVSSFSRKFKDSIGLSPKEFRCKYNSNYHSED